MTIWCEHVLTLYSDGVHVFKICERIGDSKSNPPKYLLSMPFSEPMAFGQFLQPSADSLHMILQRRIDPVLHHATVYRNDDHQDASFSNKEFLIYCPIEGDGYQENRPYYHIPGASGRVILTITRAIPPWRRPNLFWWVLDIQSGSSYQGHQVMKSETIPLDKDNLPLLHLLSCADFDDGHGILVMSATYGDIRVVSIEQERILTLDSIPGLPRATDSIPGQSTIFEVCTSFT